MKVFERDMRHGRVKLSVESLDDLWYLSNIIAPGDLVKAKTERRLKAKEDMERAGKSERVTITIAIRVEKGDFKLENDSYRINGTIAEGPEDLVSIGSHHTINVETDTVLTVIKDCWNDYEKKMLYDAERSAMRPKLLIAVMDEGDASFGLVRESKIESYDLSAVIGGKYDTKGREERKKGFYRDAAEFISGLLKKEKVSAVILAGAGFEKENFQRYLSENYPDIASRSMIENIGTHGRAGITEVMKRSQVKKAEEEVSAARDIRMVNRLLEEIGKDSGLAAYGLKDVEAAADNGAVETLIVCDDNFIGNRKALEPVMQNVKNTHGEVHIVNHAGEAGSQLASLGGVGAVLRYKIY